PGGTLEDASIGDLTTAEVGGQGTSLLAGPQAEERGAAAGCASAARQLARALRSGAEMADAATQRMAWNPAPHQGWVAPHIASEFPGLGIAWVEVDAKPGKSPEPVRRRLRDLSDRTNGAQAIRLRERPIPWAYRVFYRQIG